MKYTYRLTPEINDKIQQLVVRRQVIDLLDPPESIVHQIRNQSLLQSALFSAKIEGNPLTEAEALNGNTRHNLEVQRLLSAYEWIFKNPETPLTLDGLRQLHSISMKGLDEAPGYFRREQTAIFNMAGVAVYVPPPAFEVAERLNQLLVWLKKNADPVPAAAAAAQFEFEKIHPFIDGNGRVGRLLSGFILNKGGFGFRGMVSVEQVIEQKREEYYSHLLQTGKDISGFVDFYVECLLTATYKLLETLKNTKAAGPEGVLLPRQREIYLILRDHPEVSFDFLRRRFLAVPKSTLHYDLNQLVKKKLVMKVGSTRGALYRVKINV